MEKLINQINSDVNAWVRTTTYKNFKHFYKSDMTIKDFKAILTKNNCILKDFDYSIKEKRKGLKILISLR